MALRLECGAPQCLSCIRRMSGLGQSFRMPAGHQIRGKKKVSKATTINVKLRTNIAGFGRKGSIVPVPPGTMRNAWFPRKMAEYQTFAQLKDLGDVIIEKDPTFNPQKSDRLAQEKEGREAQDAREAHKKERLVVPDFLETQEAFEAPVEAAIPIGPEILSPEQAAIIVANLLPANVEFYRTPVPAPPPPKKVSSSLASNSALSAAAVAAAATTESSKPDPQKPTRTAIYGSVSTTDIAANLKAILWEDGEGSRVVLSPENILFVEQPTLEGKDRVKHLGSFVIDIRFGPSESERVRRTITVKAQN